MQQPGNSSRKRRLQIVELARKTDEVRVEALSVLFGVSTVTIRNDLRDLEQQGYVVRACAPSHGPPHVSPAHAGRHLRSRTAAAPFAPTPHTLVLDRVREAIRPYAAACGGLCQLAEIIRQYAAHEWPQDCIELAGRFADFPLAEQHSAPAAMDAPRVGY